MREEVIVKTNGIGFVLVAFVDAPIKAIGAVWNKDG